MLGPVSRLTAPLRTTAAALREAMANEGIRRLEISWLLGIASDTALTVALLVVAYTAGGPVAAGLLGAIRMVPAVVSGMLSGAILARFRGDRVLLAIAIVRTLAAAGCAAVIVTGGPLVALFVLAAVASAAGAPVRPTQATLMPALARSPGELVAANMAWSTGEGIGAMAGPFVAGILVAAGMPGVAAVAAAIGFAATAIASAGLRFEHAADAGGGIQAAGGGLRLVDGLRALRRRPVPGWSMLGVFGQVATRGMLNVLVVVAAIELLALGEPGVGLLNGAFGLGSLVGAIFAVSLTRTDALVRTQAAALAYWGAPIALLGLVPNPAIGLAALVVIGVANAVYDVAVLTIMQRGCANDERGPVFSVFEGVAGLGMVAGSLVAPALLAAFGTRTAFVVAGAFLPILSAVIYARIAHADKVSAVDERTLGLMRRVEIFGQLPLTAVERLTGGLVPVAYAAGDTDDNGYDHAGEPSSMWAFLRLGVDRGSIEEGEKPEDIDLNGFGMRIWPVNGK